MRWSLLAVCLLLVAPATAAARPPVLEAPYTGQPVGIGCGFELPVGHCPDVPGPNVQFGPFPSPERVDVAIADRSGERVGGEIVFYSEAGAELGRASFCARAAKLPAPEGTTFVRVLVDTAFTELHCPHLVPVTTTGVVSLRLRG